MEKKGFFRKYVVPIIKYALTLALGALGGHAF